MSKAYQTTFRYTCEMAFNRVNGGSKEIMKECIKFIMIDHDYNKRIMPVIYVKVNLEPSLYNEMVPDQGKAKIYLKISSIKTKGSTSSRARKVIYDEFDYYMTDDPNAFKRLDEITNSDGLAYKECYIGLIKTELQEKNKKSFEGIYKNTNIMSLVQSATSGMKMIIQPFVNNTEIETFVCPPLTSIGQFIAYLNSQYSFYNGSYMYYMDFDKTYLRSNDGAYIDANDSDMPYIAFDVRDLTSYQALTTGIVEDTNQGAHIVFVSATDAEMVVDKVSNQVSGQITSVDQSKGEIGSAAVVDTTSITNLASNIEAQTIINSSDPNAAKNTATVMVENTDIFTITKIDMNTSVFTPNKQYLLSNYEDNPKYCGVYYMVSKKEIYLTTGIDMSCQTTITLKKCADYLNQSSGISN